MRTAEIPAAHVDVLAVASKYVGVPTVPALGEATVIVGDAHAAMLRVRKVIVSTHLMLEARDCHIIFSTKILHCS